MTQDVLRLLKERDLAIETIPVNAVTLAELIKKVKAGEVPSSRAREVFQAMADGGVDVATAMQSIGIAAVDESELIALCEKLLAANPKTISDVKSGKVQAIGALIGQAKKLNPNIDPSRLREICLQLVESAHP